MVIRNLAAVAAAATMSLSCAAPASAAAFVNGSFELGSDPVGALQLAQGAAAIAGWTIGGGGVDYVGSGWMAQDGHRSIDLSGTGAGNIAQTFDTVAGRTYSVTFYLSGNFNGGPLTKTVSTSATGNAAQINRFDATHSTAVDMGWIPVRYDFTAVGDSTTLRFASLTEGAAGPAIDGVTISSAPEAASWAMMVGGFGLLGSVMRLRDRTNKQFI